MKITRTFVAAMAFSGLLFSASSAAPRVQDTSPQHARRLHFARGAATLRVRGFLNPSQHRFYTLPMRARQRLRVEVLSIAKNPDLGIVPLVFVTPPRGRFDGEKTAIYSANSSRAGRYKIEVTANLMASNGRSGPFTLLISAR